MPIFENEGWNKRVESTGRPCLDEGSIPSSSTNVSPSEDYPREGSCFIWNVKILVVKYTNTDIGYFIKSKISNILTIKILVYFLIWYLMR